MIFSNNKKSHLVGTGINLDDALVDQQERV